MWIKNDIKGNKQIWYSEDEYLQLKAENARLKSCLQEIKEIADARCNECKYGKDGISCKYGDCGEAKLHLITQLITKAENKEYCTCNTEKYIQTLQEIKARIPEDYKIYQWYEDVIQLITKAESEEE